MEQRGARNRRAEGAAFGGRHVNFLHLKYFLMVAEELNITRLPSGCISPSSR